ncbi:kinesin-like protein KIF20B [Scomber japonicus]|uniref:kinesin-like protein KIF20B n=1 Tax=Scomber japonicus TaxID=13676 RepID=UPI00230505BF|nr:kinesin-like protein KIF20B [Scomber japonicus]
MMETCSNSSADRQEQVEADDLKRDLSSDCSVLPDPQSIMEEREHLQVYLRIRPFTSAESDSGESQDCVTIESPDTVLLKPPGSSLSARLSTDKPLPQTGQRFQFSQVYGPDTSQKQLFDGTVKDLVKDVLEGGNSLVFTYGITNAGKTFTFLGPDADAGILPRSLDVIFSSIDGNVFTDSNVKPHRCREVTRLSTEQRAEEAAFKRNLFRQLKESERMNASLLNSTNKTLLEGSSVLGSTEDRINLDVESNAKFSVWVSFCEIYNENIHDLLEAMPSKAPRRTALRLSQDVKGNTYVKDLRWVQVNSADEAYKVMKLGKNNQSFSSTKLNQVSSRSHSIFSIRILRIEDVGSPRVHTVSELCLCDLAGSERCAKTQNKGERLKEAGNINTSLLILGKCINALRHNQQAKLIQHVPFRESKLTHYLQGFFCGRGKACMIVNVNQCASMYDETLNVLKFSAVAQKVVVLSSRILPIMHQRSASEVSFINNERKAGTGSSRRRSSLIGWESSLEDVQEDDDDEGEEEESLMDDTVDQSGGSEEDEKIVISKKTHQKQASLLKQLQVQLKQERAETLLMEVRVRDEISREFSELFSEMQNDYNDRLSREREILEEQAERRMEIFKNLIDKMVPDGSGPDSQALGISLDSGDAAEVKEVKEEKKRVEEQLDLKTTGESSGANSLLLQLQQKTSEVSQLERRAADLQNSHEREQLKQLSAALEREKKAREEALTALEYQTMGKEEALVSLEEEREAREETIAALRDLKKSKQEAEAALEEERKSKEEAEAALEGERKSKEEAEAALAEETRSREGALAALSEEKLGKEEARSVLEAERNEISKLAEEREKRQQESDELQQEVRELAAKVKAAEQQEREETSDVNEKLREQEESSSKKQLEELKQRQREEKETSDELIKDLKQQLSEQEKSGELLKSQLEEAKCRSDSNSAAEDDLKKLNSDLHAEIASLKEKLEAETPQQTEEKSLELSEVLKKLRETEARAATLQKSLKEAQERREEEESQAVQEARRREAERRRELLAVAHEAIAQKDEELEKKAEEINRLKENAKQETEKVKSLGLDLQRKEDDTSDLREKLADYKKQMQQVQKEISTMREEERVLKQKLSDAEKSKKQLQSDVANRDRTVQQLRAEQSSDAKSDQTLQLYQKACKDLEAKERVVEDMRLALTEQEETQEQMDEILEEKLNLIQELTSEVEKLKGKFLQQDHGNASLCQTENPSHDLKLAKQEAAQAQESLKLSAEKHQTERRKWLEEKLSLIAHAKEAEDKRNQEMRKFADDRERYARQQRELESLSSQLAEKDQTMDQWRKERDTLVAALEVQLQKLLRSQAEKDKQQVSQQKALRPSGVDGGRVAELESALSEKETEISQLKDELKTAMTKQVETTVQVSDEPLRAHEADKSPGESETINRKSGGRKDIRASVSSQGSSGYPSVLDSSEISTDNGRTSRFPRPELEISFSPLQPNRMALRRQGDENAVTVKITRSARKRKSGEMEKCHIFRRSKRRTTREEEVEAENRRNTRTKMGTKLTPHKEEISSSASRHNSQSSIRSRKEGALQKIGDFLQSSPTLLGSKAKKMMSLVSGRSDADLAASSSSSSSSSSLSLRAKKSKRKLYRPEISSPIDMPAHPIITRDAEEEKESDHQIIKRRLRSRMVK